MASFRKSLFLTVLAINGIVGAAGYAKADIAIDFSKYGAVAYSPATGKYGYSWNWGSKATAERVAIANCKADDARAVGWVKGGWLVLAVADDNAYGVGYCYGNGANSIQAQIDALNDCARNTKSLNRPKIKLIVCSGDVAPRVFGN